MHPFFVIMSGFLLVFAVLAFVVYIDLVTQVINPPKLNHSQGSADAGTDEAAATHHEDKTTGQIRADASVNGLGRAQASAEIGHEFQNTRKKPRRFSVLIKFDYRTHVQVNHGQARSHAIVKAVLAPQSKDFADAVQTIVGQQDSPPAGGFTSHKHKFPIILRPNQKITALLQVTAIAEPTDQAEEAERTSCCTEVEGKVTEIRFQPRLLY